MSVAETWTHELKLETEVQSLEETSNNNHRPEKLGSTMYHMISNTLLLKALMLPIFKILCEDSYIYVPFFF